jgi:hypothetical protein
MKMSKLLALSTARAQASYLLNRKDLTERERTEIGDIVIRFWSLQNAASTTESQPASNV